MKLHKILALLLAVASIMGCGEETIVQTTGGLTTTSSLTSNSVTVRGSFTALAIEKDPGQAFGQITSLYVNNTVVPFTQSVAYYDVWDDGFFNIFIMATNGYGDDVFGLMLNEVFGSTNYLNSYSSNYPPSYPALSFYLADNGKYYEASPTLYGTGGIVNMAIYFDEPKEGDMISGTFELRVAYRSTSVTATSQALGYNTQQ